MTNGNTTDSCTLSSIRSYTGNLAYGRLAPPRLDAGTQADSVTSARARPLQTTAALQKRLRVLMAKEAIQQVHADLVSRELIGEDSTFTFHGLRKNACCYLLKRGRNDNEVGEILGMSPEMVRHYGKRARALMVARGAADRMNGGSVVTLHSPVIKSVASSD